MSHEWNDDKSQDYLSSILAQGASMDAASKALAKDAVGWQHEFILHQPLIPFDYNVNEEGRWVDGGGKTVEELNDPNDIGGDRIGRTLHAESGLMSNSDVKMAATISPDLGYGRSFVYLYSRGEDNTIRALAVEFKGTEVQLQRFFVGLGIQGGADISNSADQNQALFLTKEINANQIFEEAKNSLSGDSSQNEYLERLAQSTSTYPLLLEERNRQVEQYANKALETMLSQENIQQGLAMAVFGVMELAGQTTENTIKQIYTDSVDTINGVIDYIAKKDDITENPITNEYIQTDWMIPHTVNELLLNESSPTFIALSINPSPEIETNEDSVLYDSLWKNVAQDTLHISSEQSELLYIDLVNSYEVMETASDIISISSTVEFMPVGGALHALEIIAGNSEENISSPEHSIVDNINVTAYNEVDLLTAEIHTIDIVPILKGKNISPELIELTESLIAKFESERSDESIDFETVIQTVDFLKILQDTPEFQWEPIIEKEKVRIHHQMELLKEIFQFFLLQSSEIDPAPQGLSGVSTETEYQQTNLEVISQEQHIHQFSFAVTLLLLYEYMNYFSSLEKIQIVVQKNKKDNVTQTESHISLIQSLKESSKDIIEKEPAPWLLFAIIWHLAMIREQGFAQSSSSVMPPSTSQKSKKKKSNAQQGSILIPSFFDIPTGVIYTFNHAMIEV